MLFSALIMLNVSQKINRRIIKKIMFDIFTFFYLLIKRDINNEFHETIPTHYILSLCMVSCTAKIM